jgi:aromatic-L-amino-acid decarboxylase
MDWAEFSRWGRTIADWAGRYHATLRERPVRAQTRPGAIAARIAKSPPEAGEPMDALMADFEAVVLPGMTHWQHPRFFAYFPANAAPPSILAEILVSTLAAQCMLWQTSPAATELETVMLDWLRQAIGLPDRFRGVIQDSASSATLAAVLVMRERALAFSGNRDGLAGQPRLRVYASAEAHTSIDRAIWIAGVGERNLVRIPVSGPRRAMDAGALAAAIRADLDAGHLPIGVVACTGATGVGACDDIAAVVAVARAHSLYVHVDAAWAGSAMICPEFRHLWRGVEDADSVVFNPHKWLGAQFDCSAHFIADPASLVRTLAIRPEYLKTHGADGVVNYSEWSVPLGRRFRALKLWFLLRSYGLEHLRARIRDHVRWAGELAEDLGADPRFEIVTPPALSLFSFRLAGRDDAAQIAYVNAVNDDGRIYVTQTQVDGRIAVRFQVGQFGTTRADVEFAGAVLRALAAAAR